MGGKSQSSSLQEGVSHKYTLGLGSFTHIYNMIEHIPIRLRPFGLKYVSICYINYSRKLPKVFISPTNGIKTHGSVGQRWQGYWDSFRSWSGNKVCVLEAFSQMEQGGSLYQLKRGQYIAPSKPIKPTQTILEKAQQRSIRLTHEGETIGLHMWVKFHIE